MPEDIEKENAINEVNEIIEKCISCGMCKALCPVFRIIGNEAISPRGKALELKEEVYDKIVYECTLCKACEFKCPLNLKLTDAFRKAREVLVLQGREMKENKEMISNIKEHGNPFGSRKGEDGKLYCC